MTDYTLLSNLLPLIAEFEKERHGEVLAPANLEEFAAWLHQWALMQKQFKDKRIPENTPPELPRGEGQDVTLGKLVYYMYRYARFYTKKALKDSALNSLDEFTFLVTLLHIPTITKTELINKMVYDKTTGIELINRLIKQGLIAEAENPADKRSKLIHISDLGRITLFTSFEQLSKVSNIIPGNLSPEELHTLIHLLDKLDHHHLTIWDNHKDADLDTILKAGKE